VGSARVQVARSLHDRETTLIEDFAQSCKPGMQTECLAGAVTSNLQNLAGRNRDSGPAAVIERVLIGHHRAQRVVAATQIDHHEITSPGALRESDFAQKRGRGEADSKCRHTVTDELSSANHLLK
jgi:hypothetical protein